jgi:hypothetical protein
MKSKYELTISLDYVPDWGVVEAVRELFQNAIDNEAVNPANKMMFKKVGDTLTVANRQSRLSLDTLLLGCSSKVGDERTIGQHGEGYKIALVVLLRNNKKVRFLNYGANEIWETRIVNSRRYNGAKVVQIEVDKTPIWKRTPDNDLTILVEGITDEEYAAIIKSNITLRKREGLLKDYVSTPYGDLLLEDSDAGRIYIKGLYVCDIKGLKCGYNIDRAMKLDRDRGLIAESDAMMETSRIWTGAVYAKPELAELASKLVLEEAADVRYLTYLACLNSDGYNKIAEVTKSKFIEQNGEDACPVYDDDTRQIALLSGYAPVITRSEVCRLVGSLYSFDSAVEADSLSDVLSGLKELRDDMKSDGIEEYTDRLGALVSRFELLAKSKGLI